MSSSYFHSALVLSKIRITVMVAVTTSSGFILANGKPAVGMITAVLGIFLLACGSSVINQLQEIRTDALMDRTKNRPLPAGLVGKPFAFMLAFLEVAAGSLILFLFAGTTAGLLGLTALAWYNGVYTPIKKFSAHAVIPGSVIGAIPPLVGWVAGGGSLTDWHAWVMVSFFFLWQVPHFYLLALKYGKQYEAAGFPTILSWYSPLEGARLVYYWVMATSVSAILLWRVGFITSMPGIVMLLAGILTLNIYFLKPVVRKEYEFKPITFFHRINLFVLLVILLLSFDKLPAWG